MPLQSRPATDSTRDPVTGPRPKRRRRKRTSPSDLRGDIQWNAEQLAKARLNRRKAWDDGGQSEFVSDRQERQLLRLYEKQRELRQQAARRGIEVEDAIEGLRLENMPHDRRRPDGKHLDGVAR